MLKKPSSICKTTAYTILQHKIRYTRNYWDKQKIMIITKLKEFAITKLNSETLSAMIIIISLSAESAAGFFL